jgi:hypothetical protein
MPGASNAHEALRRSNQVIETLAELYRDEQLTSAFNSKANDEEVCFARATKSKIEIDKLVIFGGNSPREKE